MTNLTTFFYNESPIQFDWINGNLMANATLMGKPHNVKPADVFKLKYWQQYEKALVNKKHYRFEDLRTVKNGDNGGSWIHQELIIEFARRLSPDFAIWCNDRIAELLREGKTQIKPKSEIEILLQSVQILADQDKKIKEIDNRINVLEAKQESMNEDYFAVMGYCSVKKIKIDRVGAAKLGKKASSLCKTLGYSTGKVNHPIFGTVNTYPSEVLEIVLGEEKNL
jgi:hypothetical protein